MLSSNWIKYARTLKVANAGTTWQLGIFLNPVAGVYRTKNWSPGVFAYGVQISTTPTSPSPAKLTLCRTHALDLLQFILHVAFASPLFSQVVCAESDGMSLHVARPLQECRAKKKWSQGESEWTGRWRRKKRRKQARCISISRTPAIFLSIFVLDVNAMYMS